MQPPTRPPADAPNTPLGPYRTPPARPPLKRSWWPWAIAAAASVAAIVAGVLWPTAEERRRPGLAGVPAGLFADVTGWPLAEDALPPATPLAPLLVADQPAALAVLSPGEGALRVQRGGSVRVRFNRPMVEGHVVGRAVEASPLVFEPEVAGETRWTSRSTVMFQPAAEVWGSRVQEVALSFAEGVASLSGEALHDGFERTVVLDGTPRVEPGRSGGRVHAGAALPLFFDAPVQTGALQGNLLAYEIGGGHRSLGVRLQRAQNQPERGFRIDVMLDRALEPGARIGLALAPRYQSWGGSQPTVLSYQLAPPPSIEGVSCSAGAAFARQCRYQGSPGEVVDIGPALRLLASQRLAGVTAQNVRITPPLREMRLRLAPHGPPARRLVEIHGEWDPDQVYEVRVNGLTTEDGEAVRALPPLAVRSSGHEARVRVAVGLRTFEADQPASIAFATIHPGAGDVLYRPVAEGEELGALLSRGPFVRQGGVSSELARLAPEARANRWGPGRYRWRSPAQPSSMAVVAFRPDASARSREMRTAFVQATDLGVTARAHPGGILVWVTSLSSGEPVDGAVVQVADAQANVLQEATTDADGVARVRLSANPLVVTHALRVVSGDDRAAMLLDPRQAVGPAAMGVSPGNAERTPGPVASVFTDRGAYRPGERLRAKVVLRQVRGSRARPVRQGTYTLRLMSPAGAAPIAELERTPNRFGTLDAEFDLPAAAALGRWRVEIARGGRGGTEPALGSAGLQVAQFRQPTFRVDLEDIEGPVHAGDALAVNASGTYLFGAPVSRGRMTWSLTRTGPAPMPERWRRYRFSPVGGGRVRGTIASGELALGHEGPSRIEAPATLSGPVRTHLVLEAEVTDGAGHTQAARRRWVAYPAEYEVGVRSGDDWQQLGDPIDVDAVAIDHDGTPVSGRSVDVEIVREGWHSWWEWSRGNTGGAYQLRRDRGEDVAHRCSLTSSDEPVHCVYTPRRSGTYLLRVSSRDAEGRRAVASRRVYVAGPDEHPDRDPPGAPIQVTPTRARWTVGETAELAFESPWEGARALITVERNGVIGVEQREVGAGGQVVRIPVRRDMVPNVFVGVTLVRPRVGEPAEGVDLNAPDLRFGVAELRVRPETSALSVGLEVAASARPGTEVPVTVTVRDADGRPVEGEVALWAVDEGTLRLTGYQVPDPSRGLFRSEGARFAWEDLRRGLVSRVETPPMPRSGGDGGEDMPTRPTDDRERFEPTPLWRPTLLTDARGRATVTVTLPARPTEYRVMAVAVDDGMRVGRSSAQLVAEQPLVVRAAFPTFVTSGDRFEAAAFVHNTTDGPLDVELRVRLGEHDEPARTVTLAAGGEHRVAVPVTAPDPGWLALRVEAQAGEDETAVEERVRVVPRGRYVRSQVFVAGEGSRELSVGLPEGTPTEVGTAGITVASHPFVGVAGAVEGLEASHWGGVATAAGVVLGLAAHDAMGIADGHRDADETRARGRLAVRRLLAMQGYDGGFARWSSASGGMPAETALAVHALHAGVERGWLAADDPRIQTALEALRRQAVGSAFGDFFGPRGVNENAFALRVLADFERPEAARATALFEQRERLTPYGLSQLAMALGEADPRVETLVVEAARQVLTTRAEEAKHPGRVRTWPVSPHMLGAALEAASRFRVGAPYTGRLAAALLGYRHAARRLPWGTPAETGRALHSLAQYAELWQWAPEATPRVLLDGEPLTLTSRSRAGAFFQLPIHRVVGQHTLTVEGGDTGPVFAAVDGTWAVPLSEQEEVARGRRVALHRVYETADGRALEPGSVVPRGTMVRVRLFTYLEGSSPTMVGLYDPLPAGFEAVDAAHDTTPRASLAALLGMSPDDDTWDARAHHAMRSMGSIAHRTFDAHATSFYFDALPHGLAEFTYALRATTGGRFTVPPAQIEGYLEPDFVARSTAGALGVE